MNSKQVDLRTMPVLDEQYQNIKHPYMDFTVGEAVALAINNANTFGRKAPSSLREVRDYIEVMMQDYILAREALSSGNAPIWYIGDAALDVLDAAIDGRDIAKDYRYQS